jgi:hypothetical protein
MGAGRLRPRPREVLRGVFLYLRGRRARDPKEQRRAEQLEHRLQVDEHGEEVRDRRQEDRELDREDEEERHRHRH